VTVPSPWTNAKPVDLHASDRLADTIDARVGECAANIARAFLDFRSSFPTDAEPVQGYWMIGGQLGLHTWIETPNMIIDPTLAAHDNASLRSSARHHAIRRLTETELRDHYGSLTRAPGTRLDLIVS
jgi:hypothetical protein